MPTAPLLPPDQMQQQATGGVDPQNFLMAAADLHQQGALSSPVPAGKDLPAFRRGQGRSRKTMKVVK